MQSAIVGRHLPTRRVVRLLLLGVHVLTAFARHCRHGVVVVVVVVASSVAVVDGMRHDDIGVAKATSGELVRIERLVVVCIGDEANASERAGDDGRSVAMRRVMNE